MKESDIQMFIDRADELWTKQNFEFDKKYICRIWFDGDFLFTQLRRGFEEDNKVGKLLEHIQKKINLLNESADIFNSNMEEKGDKWKMYISEEIRHLQKQEVMQMFNSDYAKLLVDYEKLYKQVEELLKE